MSVVETLAQYIERWADDIYVREQLDGKWGSFALAELPVKLAMRHAIRLLAQGGVPVRVLRDKVGDK